MPDGPVYCETGHPWLGIAEPVNFFTNVFILLAALLAVRLVLHAPARRRVGPWVLIALLLATGISSFLWHGFRTPLALRLDGLCGVAFLIALIFLWASGLYGWVRGLMWTAAQVAAMAMGLMLSFFVLARGLDAADALRPLILAPFFLVVAVGGAGLVLGLHRQGGPGAGRLALGTLGCGVAAALARSADLASCAVLPFGTHFLWHGFLSLAAYGGISALLALYEVQANTSPRLKAQ